MHLLLRGSPSRSNSFSLWAIPTESNVSTTCVLNSLRTARQVLIHSPDEVARNGALRRITSARGFLGRPDCIPSALPGFKDLDIRPPPGSLPPTVKPAPAVLPHQCQPGATGAQRSPSSAARHRTSPSPCDPSR